MSFDTVLRKGLRDNAAMAQEVKRHRAAYCVADDLLRGIDRIAGDAEENTAGVRERRISYALTTGANWLGPVKDFRLVVDKGRPDRSGQLLPRQCDEDHADRVRGEDEGLHPGTRPEDPADRKGRLTRCRPAAAFSTPSR